MASEMQTAVRKKHSMILEDRKQISFSGVNDVAGFDDHTVTLITELGELCIKGEKLHINDFSQETGELNIDGKIDSLVYSETHRQEGGFFSRLFK